MEAELPDEITFVDQLTYSQDDDLSEKYRSPSGQAPLLARNN